MKNQTNVVVKQDSFRESLLGIHNAYRCQMKKMPYYNGCVEDPRYRPSGMTANFTTVWGFTQQEKDVAFCPPCGESVAGATKEGQNRKRPCAPSYPRLTAVLPPQGREMFCGFTLIEILVAVLIIGILAAVALPQYQKAVEKSRAVTVLNVLKAIASAQEVYYLANGQYATNFNDLDVELPHEGELIINTRDDVQFKDGSRYYMYVRSEEGTQSVKGSPKGLAGVMELEFYFEHHWVNPDSNTTVPGSYVQCNGRTERGKKICQALGAEYFRSSGNTDYYILQR